MLTHVLGKESKYLWASVKHFIAVFIKLKERGICLRNVRLERSIKIISSIKSQAWRNIIKCSSSSFKIFYLFLIIFVKDVGTKSKKMFMGCSADIIATE